MLDNILLLLETYSK